MPKRMSLVSTALALGRSRRVLLRVPTLPRLHVRTTGSSALGPRSARLFPDFCGVSEALVRHGADPREALAEVLGIPGQDIRVRDRPE
jgi:hypothetical protein